MHTTPLSMHGRSALDAVAMAYAREVYIRNESQLQGLSHNLVTTFHDASLKFVDKVTSQITAVLLKKLGMNVSFFTCLSPILSAENMLELN